MSAEAYYFSMYSSEVPVPTGVAAAPTPVHPAEACYFAMYNSNCTFPTETVTTTNSENCHTTKEPEKPTLRARAPNRIAGVASALEETPWPSETFNEVPTGTMTLRGFLETLHKNIEEAKTWKPAGYIKALLDKVFTFGSEPAKIDEVSKST